MLLKEWKKSWRHSREFLEAALVQLGALKSPERFSSAALAEIFGKFGIPQRASVEVCAADDNAWAWVLHFLDELAGSGRQIACFMPQRNESVLRILSDGPESPSAYYAVKGSHTVSSLAIKLMREKACDLLLFSPAAIEMKLLKLPAGGNSGEDAYNIAFGRAIMALSQAADIYGVPVMFLRRMTHRNDSRGLSAVECRVRICTGADRRVRVRIEKDRAAAKISFAAAMPDGTGSARQLEFKYMLDI